MANPTLPESPEYERVLLSTLFSNPEVYYKISTLVTPKDFYSLIRAEILTICGKLIAKDCPIDCITILETFSESETKFDRKALEDEINAILETVGVESSIDFYGQEVKRLAIKRRLYRHGMKIVQKYLEKDTDHESVTAELYSKLGGVDAEKKQSRLLNVREYASEYLDLLVSRRSTVKNGIIGLPTGFVDIDLMTSGFKDISFIGIAGRPSHGKSTLLGNIIENIAYETGKSCLLFSLESGRDEILDKFLASKANLDTRKIRIGNFNGNDWERVRNGMAEIYNQLNVFIDDEAVRTMDDIYMISHLAKQKFGISLIGIDYLQLVKPNYRPGQSRTEQVGEISRRCKIISKELKIPVVGLSQLSRDIEKRQDKQPMLSDLRESGSLEQDLDLAFFIQRPELYKSEPDNVGMAELYLLKQRGGPIGSCKLRFQKEYSRFVTRMSVADIPIPEEDVYDASSPF